MRARVYVKGRKGKSCSECERDRRKRTRRQSHLVRGNLQEPDFLTGSTPRLGLGAPTVAAWTWSRTRAGA